MFISMKFLPNHIYLPPLLNFLTEMKITILFQCLLLMNSSWSFAQEKYYTQPVKIPVILSGNFGELRPNHFHTGIDIKTQGQTGVDVLAAADGFVSRVSVSPGGYGNVLYIDHPNGTTTAYGHLLRFRDDIKNFITNLQYQNESFTIDTKIPEGKFRVKKGDFIAKSGNSGSSGGPHLHFEVRDTRSQDPQNPFFLGFNIRDLQPPKIYALLVCPVGESSRVNNSARKVPFQLALVNGKYQVNGNKPISCSGEIGLEISASDFFDETANRFGVYSVEMKAAGTTLFSFSMDRLTFSTSKYINSHIDYEYFFKTNRRYIRTWIEPGNYLQIYQARINNGLIKMEEGKTILAEIIVKDAAGNKAVLEVKLEGKPAPAGQQKTAGDVIFRFNRPNDFENDEMKLSCPIGAFYNDIEFDYTSENRQVPFFSGIHRLHSPSTPIHNPLKLKIRASDFPAGLESKLCIAGLDRETGHTTYAGGKFEDGWVETSLKAFGTYAIVIDTIAPYVVPVSIKNNALTETGRLRFRISDNFSGVREVRGTLDGKWALFETDIKTSIYTHVFDPERFEFKKKHEFRLEVTDNQGNRRVYEASFWK